MDSNAKKAPELLTPKEKWLADRQKSWDREAKNLYSALMLLGHVTKAHNVLECGHAFLSYHCPLCGNDDRLKLSCQLRLCPRCATRRSLRFIARHALALASVTKPKLLTLTFKSPQSLTPEFITFASKCFAKLRRRALWTTAVSGGLAGLEMTWSPSGWHPHFHALIDSDFIFQYYLRKVWNAITEGSWLVDIRQCDVTGGVHEVAKYVAKGSTFYTHPILLRQFLSSTKGRRFFTTFGSFYRIPTTAPTDTVTTKYPILPSIYRLTREYGPSPPACTSCGGLHLIAQGKVLENPLDPPPIQIPLRKEKLP